MTKDSSCNGQKIYGLCVGLVILLIIPFLSGCGEDRQASSPDESSHAASDTETASATFTVQWHDAVELQDLSSAAVTREALDCEASGVADVTCQVYDNIGTLLVTGGPWPCANGGARIDGIPVGQNRMFVVLAEDAQGDVRFQGETPGINVGQQVPGVTIDAFPFVPDLLTPADDATQVDPANATLTWTSVANADQYLVEVAQDSNFNNIAIDQIHPVSDPDNPEYVPAGLQTATTYFWRISAVDINSNIGAASAVRSFSTADVTPPTVTITSPTSSASHSTTTGVLDIAGTASDNVGVTQVSWSNNQGGSGTCSGTTSWSAGGIKLVLGDNIITVTATDAAENTSTDTLTVNYRLPADYIITALSLGSTSVLRGTTVSVTFRAQNQGGEPLNCINMGIYLSTDAAITTADTQLQRWGLANCNIAAGQFLSQTQAVTIPADTPPGSYYIGIIADVDQNETESNENNNTMATPITIYILG